MHQASFLSLPTCHCLQYGKAPTEELGRHRGKNDDRQCKLCGEECESVIHVLWECPAYDTIRNTFIEDLDNLLGGSFEEFNALNNFERTLEDGLYFRV